MVLGLIWCLRQIWLLAPKLNMSYIKQPKRDKKVTAEWRHQHNQIECKRRKQLANIIKQLAGLLPLGHLRKKDKTSILEEVVHYLRVVYENVANVDQLERAFIAQEKATRDTSQSADCALSFLETAELSLPTCPLEKLSSRDEIQWCTVEELCNFTSEQSAPLITIPNNISADANQPPPAPMHYECQQ
ncbi:uncharacterized protein LOC129581557 isoform X2 [Paramacrobiotus metropolitanus]|uniref:uncharacterized protein LOC129581557 isoform X2 n=1 Tax=Paramacrobiotus metropolitanus TaxID=2943436 RepID=UPI0024458555|nr:uncharacterized protein LOC129581557 isoform X2 [Paramacrobiotus metropolitanus]